MVTIYDIARKANCSAMTVSRVINNTGRISEKTRQRVKAIMAEMNYVPNSLARSLVVQETRLLSLMIADITNPFFTTLARGAEDAARQLGYRLLLSNSDEDLKKEREYVDAVLSSRADGVLIAPCGNGSRQNLEILKKQGVPFVLIDREVDGIEADVVLGDSKVGARKLTELLIGLGHRNIAMLNAPRDISTARLRYEGCREALRLNRLPWRDDLYAEARYTRLNADAIIDRWLALPDRPTAVFAANNILALAAIRSLRARGLRVPDDISVVCFEDLEADYVVDPFLTVVSQPAYDFGSTGIKLLVDRIRGAGDFRKVTLPSTLVSRKSAAPLAGGKAAAMNRPKPKPDAAPPAGGKAAATDRPPHQTRRTTD